MTNSHELRNTIILTKEQLMKVVCVECKLKDKGHKCCNATIGSVDRRIDGGGISGIKISTTCFLLLE